MNAAVLYHLNSPVVLEQDVEIPELSFGQLLVKVAYSGVCRSQLMEVRGGRGEDRYLPHLLGHEGSGIIVRTGPGVTQFKPRDRVILSWIKSKGIESGGVKYQCRGATLNAGAVTTFNDFAVVSENRCILMPQNLPMDIAALFGCALPTGAGIVIHTVMPKPKSAVAIFGLGGVGLSALMACSIFDCENIIAVDVSEEKLALAREFGATQCINSSKEGAHSVLLQATQGAGVDYSIECSGNTSMIENAFKAVKKNGGLCVFASHPPKGEQIKLDPHDLISGKRIQGSWGGECKPDEDIPRLSDLYFKGKLPLEKLIPRKYKLAQVNDALDDLENFRAVRPLLEIDPLLK